MKTWHETTLEATARMRLVSKIENATLTLQRETCAAYAEAMLDMASRLDSFEGRDRRWRWAIRVIDWLDLLLSWRK